MKKKMQDKRDESGVLKKNFKTFCRPQHEGERERERERERVRRVVKKGRVIGMRMCACVHSDLRKRH